MGLDSTMAPSPKPREMGKGWAPDHMWDGGGDREALHSFGKRSLVLEAGEFLGNRGTAPPQGIVGILEAGGGRRERVAVTAQEFPHCPAEPAVYSAAGVGTLEDEDGRGAPQSLEIVCWALQAAVALPSKAKFLLWARSQVSPAAPTSCLVWGLHPPACQHSVNLAQLSGLWIPRPGTQPTLLGEERQRKEEIPEYADRDV